MHHHTHALTRLNTDKTAARPFTHTHTAHTSSVWRLQFASAEDPSVTLPRTRTTTLTDNVNTQHPDHLDLSPSCPRPSPSRHPIIHPSHHPFKPLSFKPSTPRNHTAILIRPRTPAPAHRPTDLASTHSAHAPTQPFPPATPCSPPRKISDAHAHSLGLCARAGDEMCEMCEM
jgi:hypothetical protein